MTNKIQISIGNSNINLSPRFIETLNVQGYFSKKEILDALITLHRNWVSISRLNDLMKETSQVSFQIEEEGIKITDPFGFYSEKL